MKITECGGGVHISDCAPFDAAKTFDCGQAFLIEPAADGCLAGTALGKTVRVRQTEPDSFDFLGTTAEEFRAVWQNYFDLDADYAEANREIVARTPEPYREIMRQAVECGRGIRILRQDPWETLVSFLVSQNNNIPRIRKILHTLYETCGHFPTPDDLIGIGIEGLYALRTGFRAKYLYDAAVKIASGAVELAAVDAADYAEAEEMLCRIYGVGKKVAACTLLFGFHKTEAFPVDVWMQRAWMRHFPEGLDVTRYEKYSGLMQQYLFYYERWHEGKEKIKSRTTSP